MNTFISYLINITFLQSVLNPSSTQADKIYRLFNYFNIAAGCLLFAIIFMVFYICIKFRRKAGDTEDPVQAQGNKKVEAAMIGISVLLLAFFFYHTLNTMAEVSPPVEAGRQPDVIITGHQWWWEVEYPGMNVVAANEVHLPVGKNLLMEMRSADVIHDWWVPELGNKMDLVPNNKVYIWLDIHKPGTYNGACSEFCGAQHAWMRIKVIAQEENDFTQWLIENAKDAKKPKDSLAVTGAAIFQRSSCAGCHRIQGTLANANVGPDLTHLASRDLLLTGLMNNNQENLFKWVSQPQQVKPGAHMPDFKLNEDTVKAIVHYLNQLK